jgi:endonuclease/exonuclease/phosphatase family metal-dependent hydrolase
MDDVSRQIRVVTWNIHGCVGNDGRHDIDRIGGFIRAMAPDIAALQEVDSRQRSQPDVDTYTCLRFQVGDHGHQAWSLSGADGQYGQMLASRFPLHDRQVHDISVSGREPRKVMEALVELPSGSLRVIATHLGLRRGERRRQLAQLEKIVSADLSSPTVLLGDLNDWHDGSGRRLSDLFDARTTHRSFPSRFPVLALDRIMCRAGIQLMTSRAVKEAYLASDHLPVFAGIALSEPTPKQRTTEESAADGV